MSLYRFCAALILAGLAAMPAAAEQAPQCESVPACRALAPETAGPALMRFLRDEDWDARVEAALALGNIGYSPSIPGLITALADAADWQLAYAAVIGLGRMKDPSALSALRETAAAYWYPPVRVAADCAVQWLESGKPCDRHNEILDIDLGRLQTIKTDTGNCEKRPYRKQSEPSNIKQYGNEEALQQFKYTGAECAWYGDADKETGARPCLGRSILYPQLAARAADGWLTGRDQGESGGELMFFPDSGKPYEVLAANVEDIYVLESGAIAVTGFANATVKRGMVYSLRKDGGRWRAEPLFRLPGAPESSYKISKKEIFAGASGGMIVFDAAGNPKMAVCGKKR
jgi:hypothetical protein